MKRPDLVQKIAFALLIVTVATPLIVHKLFARPFEVPRALFFRTLIEIILVLIIWYSTKKKTYTFFWKHPVVIALAALTLSYMISMFAGVQVERSFWGTLQRSGGVFHWLHIMGWIFALSVVVQADKDWQLLKKIFIGVGGLVALYALAQRIGASFVYESGVDRATGTIGNAAFLGGYMLFVFYGAVYNFVEEKITQKRVLPAIIAAMSFLVIVFTQTRGAMIGLVGSAIVGACGYLALSWKQGALSNKHKTYVGASLLVVLTLVSSLFIFRDSAIVQDSNLLRRFASSIDLQDTTAQTRLHVWKKSVEVWKERPVLGWGPDNFAIAYNSVFDPSFYDISRHAWFDRAHNIIMEYLVTMGVVGVFAFLSVLATIGAMLLRKNDEWPLAQRMVLLALFLGYFIQNLLVFDSLVILYAFGFFAALVLYKTKKPFEKEYTCLGEKGRSALRWGSIVIAVVLALWINIPIAKSTIASRSAIQLLSEPRWSAQEVVSHLDRAMFLGTPWDWEIYVEHADGLRQLVLERGGQRQEGVNAIYQHLVRVTDHFHIWDSRELKDARAYQFFGRGYTLLMELAPDPSTYSSLAHDIFRKSLAYGPNRLGTSHALAQLTGFEGNTDEALEILNTLIEQAPSISDTYWIKALVLGQRGEMEAATDAMQEAIEKKYIFQNMSDVQNALAAIQDAEDKTPQQLVYLFESAVRLDKMNLQWHASLAAAYHEAGEKEKAINAARHIITIDPTAAADVEAFIQTLQ